MSEDDVRAAERWYDRMFAEQEALARAMTDVPHDTYHRILHRLRQQHAEAIMQETLDILRSQPLADTVPGVVISPLSPAELRVRDRILTQLEACLREVAFETGDGPLSLPAHEPSDILSAEYAAYRAALTEPLQARVGADALSTRQLEELSADLDAAHGIPVISCGVGGHAPDCECATL